MKTVAKRAIHSKKIVGEDEMRILAFSNNSVMNDGCRTGGCSASQWVLGKYPRSPGDMFSEDEFADLGCISEKVDGESAFYRTALIRMACNKAFAETDCSKKVASLALRKAAPKTGGYAVGDFICFKRKQGAKTPEELWSTVTRIIGFDGPKVVW